MSQMSEFMKLGRGVLLFVLSALLLVAACGGVSEASFEAPELEFRCPNPEERQTLTEGSTYRDLAASRAEALSGWERCFGALEVSEGRAGQ